MKEDSLRRRVERASWESCSSCVWPRNMACGSSRSEPTTCSTRVYDAGLAEIGYRCENLGLLAYSPLGFGTLSGKYLDSLQAPGRISRRSRLRATLRETQHRAGRCRLCGAGASTADAGAAGANLVLSPLVRGEHDHRRRRWRNWRKTSAPGNARFRGGCWRRSTRSTCE